MGLLKVRFLRAVPLFLVLGLGIAVEFQLRAETAPEDDFPRALSAYSTPPGASLWQVLKHRVEAEPVNLAATLIFFLAILHTFMTPALLKLSHRFERLHRDRLAATGKPVPDNHVSFRAEVCHFLGEVEAVFGIWTIPLLIFLGAYKGWPAARDYLGRRDFTEPIFVVVVMTIAASRPVLDLAERLVGRVAWLGRNSPAAWWFAILTLGPLLGSFITEPAAMTISALVLAERFYALRPSPKLAYATLGLLFVNVSVGGTLTPFAAPPVLMVAGKWGWGLREMCYQFGWKAAAGILAANLLYWVWFRSELRRLAAGAADLLPRPAKEPIPAWVTAVHVAFLGWTVINSHYPQFFVGGFLFYLAFTEATAQHQEQLALRPALMVGFFLAGLVVHGKLQVWWLEPVLNRFDERTLFFGAAVLTAFNDNAAITYMASLVPNFTAALKYAVVAGAVAGGGLTVIANAPNPAGQSILGKFFADGVSPWRLFLGASIPTAIVAVMFLFFR